MQHETRKHEHGRKPRTNPVGALVLVAAVLFFASLIATGMLEGHRGPIVGAGATLGMAMATSFLGYAIALTGCVMLLQGIAARRGLSGSDAARWALVVLAGSVLAQDGWGALIGLAGLAGLLAWLDRERPGSEPK